MSDPFGTITEPEDMEDHTALLRRLTSEAFHPVPDQPFSAFPSVHPTEESAAWPAPAALPGRSLTETAPAFPEQDLAGPPPVHPASPAPAGTDALTEQPEKEDLAFGEPAVHLGFRPSSAPQARSTSPAQPATPDYYFLNNPSQVAAPARPETAPRPPLSSFDVEAIRRDFPALHQSVNGRPLVFLDNAATTQKPQSVIDAVSQFYARDNSNIHRAAYALAERATAAFEHGREKVREFLGAARKSEIIFVRGTTEAINLVAQTYGRQHIGAGDEILLTRLEHHANIVPWQLLAKQVGAVIRVAPINNRGEVIVEEFARLLGPRTKIAAFAHVSNALGTINPVEFLISLAHARGVPVLVDGAQSTPHLPVNVQALDADFYVFSGHKVFGPTGIGALYGKAGLLESLPPYQGGGHMIRDVRFEKTTYQDPPEKFEAGTPDIAGVVGLGAAIEYVQTLGLPAISAYEHALLEYATPQLENIPGLRLIGTAAHKASVLSFVIAGQDNQKIARHLDRLGIAVRAGHHCALPAQRHFGIESSVRPSLAFYNTREEVDALIRGLRSFPRD